jgi:hypothetical protein
VAVFICGNWQRSFVSSRFIAVAVFMCCGGSVSPCGGSVHLRWQCSFAVAMFIREWQCCSFAGDVFICMAVFAFYGGKAAFMLQCLVFHLQCSFAVAVFMLRCKQRSCYGGSYLRCKADFMLRW